MTTARKLALHSWPVIETGWLTGLRPLARQLSTIPRLAAFINQALAVARAPAHLYHKASPESSSGTTCHSMTVISANLWHDWPRHRRLAERLEAFARLVEEEQADIVLLQEVSRTAELWADEWLAQRLGMAYVYAPANGHEQATGFEEGLAIFSRYHLTRPRVQRLEPEPFPLMHRLALAATVKTPCGDLLAVSAHLAIGRKQNSGQLAHLQSWVNSQANGRPAFIGGDFNSHENTPQVQQAANNWVDLYRRHRPHADGTTYEIHWPWGRPMVQKRLDYLFLQPGKNQWEVVDARHISAPGRPHSDHQAVVARLKLQSPDSLNTGLATPMAK